VPLEIVLARHGETEWSRDGRHTGRTDVPLTEEGHRQALLLRDALAEWTFVKVLSSPMRRALETCRLAGLADDGYWLDTGTPALLLTANMDVVDGRRGPVAGLVRGDVHPRASVHRAVVSAGCRIGAGAEVVGSVLLPGVRVCGGAVVSDSLVGPDVVVDVPTFVDEIADLGGLARIAAHLTPG